MRYAQNEEDAMEVLQDGFVKVFKHIENFVPPADPDAIYAAFCGWLKKIMVYTSIDYYRKRHRQLHWDGEEKLRQYNKPTDENPLDRMAYEELIRMVQRLSPAYKSVFNLFVIDGFSHEEISKLLNISVGTSKSNLSKARENLRQLLKATHEKVQAKYE